MTLLRRFVLLVVVTGGGAAHALQWLGQGGPNRCEPPSVYYSAQHDPSVTQPCCPRATSRCPGGVACVAGRCAAPYASVACVATAVDAPNVILSIADDEAYCDYGFMGPACRTPTSGTPLPVPATPNLDRLALQPANQGRGRYFVIAHDGASVCNPAREVIELGHLQKDNLDPTVAKTAIAVALARPDGPPYCAFGAGGKFGLAGPAADKGFHAVTVSRNVGKNFCAPAPCAPNCDAAPSCGADPPGVQGQAQTEIFDFVDAMIVHAPGGDVQVQPFFLWYGSDLPHAPHDSPPVIEDRGHPLAADDYLFGTSVAAPGTPRFPFGAPEYRALFLGREIGLDGLYGMVWWHDDGIRQLRERLETVHALDPSGTRMRALWDDTVLIHVADNGSDLPRAKHKFTENGFRSALLVHDARLPAAPGADPRVEQELAHHVDILPTILDFAGRSPAGLPGRSLRPYLSASPPAVPLRNTMCGVEATKYSGSVGKGRYVTTRPGTVGRCAPAAGPSCAADAQCGAGRACLLGTCGSGALCMEDGDCGGGERCVGRAQKWCRYGHAPLTEPAVAPVDAQPTTPCTTDADCAAGCPSADPSACTCEFRRVKLYALASGREVTTDLFVDPDEPALAHRVGRDGAPGTVDSAPIANRLRCCLDRWWAPDGGDPGCTACEPQYACHRCGDGVADADEECDGASLHGKTCADVGFGGGTLACTGACRLDTSACH